MKCRRAIVVAVEYTDEDTGLIVRVEPEYRWRTVWVEDIRPEKTPGIDKHGIPCDTLRAYRTPYQHATGKDIALIHGVIELQYRGPEDEAEVPYPQSWADWEAGKEYEP